MKLRTTIISISLTCILLFCGCSSIIDSRVKVGKAFLINNDGKKLKMTKLSTQKRQR